MPAAINRSCSWEGLVRKVLASFVAGLIALGVAANASAQNAKVVVAYTGASDFTAAYLAKDRGIFEKHGLDVELQLVANGGAATAAINSGAAQFGGLTPSVLLPAVANGLDFVVGAGAQIVPTGSKLGLLARQDLDLSAQGAYSGKTIGVPGLNGALHVLARKWIADKGEDVASVNFVEVPFGQMPDALKGKQVDLVVSADPFYGRIVAQNLAVPAGDIASVLPDQSLVSLYGATRTWANANKETVGKFVAALDEAAALVAQDPDAARAAIGNYVKLPPELLSTLAMPGLKAKVAPEQIVPWIEMSREQGIISVDIDPKTLVLQ